VPRAGIARDSSGVFVAFAWIGAYPGGSVTVVAANVLVIYHLTTAKGSARRVQAFPGPLAPPPPFDRPQPR